MSEMTTGIDEMGEVVAGSTEEYSESMRLLSDHDLALEMQSGIPTRQQHAIAVAEYNRRAIAKERGERKSWW